MVLELILLALFTAGVSTLTLFSGFGLGTLLLPAMALVLPAELAVAATALVHLANNVFKTGLLFRQADWDVVARFGLPAIAASFFGAMLLVALTGLGTLAQYSIAGHEFTITPLKLLLGVLILIFALLEFGSPEKWLRMDTKWLPLGGVMSGFFGGLSGHQGALRAIFLTSLGMGAGAYAASQAVIAIGVDVVRIAVYGASFPDYRDQAGLAYYVGAATLGALAGAILGRKLLPKITMTFVRRTTGGLLLLTGIALAAGWS